MSHKYKFKVKRPTLSKKDRGKILKRSVRGGIKARDIGRAAAAAKRKYGGMPRIPGILTGRRNDGGRDSQQRLRDNIFRRIDGGNERTMYVSGRAPSRSSSSRQSRSSEPSYAMDTSYMDQMIYDFQQQQEAMMAQYEEMMAEQAQQAEEERKKMEAAMRAQSQNAYSASLQPTLQLQGAGETPKLSGIQQFKKRSGSQFGTASPYTGLAKIKSGLVNV